MSRLRTIKPGFFVDEYLAECQPLARILFAGLWTVADRDGRLEDRPKRIKVETLPYDECDVNALLDELAAHGFIVRYECDGVRFIAIPTWHKHQSPHQKEAASTIPAPDSPGASTIQAQFFPPSSCLGSCLGSGGGNREEPLVESASDSTCGDEFDELLEGEIVTDLTPADNGFDAFWMLYPNKQGKVQSRRAWGRLSRHDRKEATEVARAMAYCVECCYRERDKCPHGSTFLHQRRWEEWRDEDGEFRAPPGYGPNGHRTEQEAALQRVAARYAANEDGGKA